MWGYVTTFDKVVNQYYYKKTNYLVRKRKKKMKKTLLIASALLLSNSAYAKIDFMAVAGEATKIAVSAYDDWKSQDSKSMFVEPKGAVQSDFYDSKVWLKQATQMNPYGFYSDCEISFSGKKKSTLTTSPSSCELNVYKNAHRSERAEAEHIVPASWYGHTLSCWKNGGRKNCQKVSESFNKMEGDLINLQYTVGSLNADRSNYKYGEFNHKNGVHDYTGQGDVMFDDHNNLFEPPEEKKGWIGRVHLYMVDKYGVKLNSNYKRLMEKWATKPATSWECTYNELVERDWGYSNPYTTKSCS